MADEHEHLQFLSMFFYAVGALAAMLSLVPGLWLFIASTLPQTGEAAPSVLVDRYGLTAAAAAAALLLLAGFGLGISMARAGYFLARFRRYRYCLAVAWVACLFVPAGTLLGAITIPVLRRGATKGLFVD